MFKQGYYFTQKLWYLWQTGNRIIETGNGIILASYRLLIKNLFYKSFSSQPNESKTILGNRKWNYFTYLQTSDQKTCFTKVSLVNPMSPKLLLETGNGIIETGNGIILTF